ncbi:hypothetical protein CYMTET_31434 [Cymbomonas tetramitiformis]|uniref:DUF7794 domain-containing protein n=1 Tax=Cymbomonas tetramitiformis TaxID=36881 RepID=A0AAE0KSZ4_9CHLO|nr:hypothetical protein CYMTET_31434 [Cymbomonas tetramitiformis]
MFLKTCSLLFRILLVCPLALGKQDIFLESSNGSYLRDPVDTTNSQWNPAASFAAVAALLGVAPPSFTDRETSDQVEKLLVPNPFSRPKIVFTLEVEGANEGDFKAPSAASEIANGLRYHAKQTPDASSGDMDKIASLFSSSAGSNERTHEHLAMDCAHDKSLEAYLHGVAELKKGSYIPAAEPMQGELALGGDGSTKTLNLNRTASERQVGFEAACLAKKAESLWPSESPRFITGKLSGLAAVQEEHGPQSEEVTAASQLMVAALQQVFGNAASANDGDMVSQLSLLGKSTDRHTSVGGQEGARRKILQSEENSRDAKIWMSTFMAISVGFFLTVLLLISICCMFDMDVKEDTLLYGNSKKDS